MTSIERRRFVVSAAAAGCAIALPARVARAQQTLRLSIGSSHPLVTSWVKPAQAFFMPEVDKRLVAAGGRYRIQWSEAWGGSLFKANATLSSVAQGVVDLGFVWSNLESSKMPLSQVSLATPFATDDPRHVGLALQDLHETLPALRREWEQHNVVWLGAATVDTYHLFTKFPVASIADLRGKKITAPGAIGLWVRDSGASVVAGNLTTFYTDVQTGVADGGTVTATGATATKIYEVAPYATLVGFGCHNNGGLAANADTWKKLPEEVRKVLAEVGREFSRVNGEAVMAQAARDMQLVQEAGSRQSTPVRISAFPAAEKRKLLDSMSDLGAEYVRSTEAKGMPGREILKAYMEALRKHGAKPLRDWA
jgi:TRAP-type transport system periplasmic protein